MLPGGDLVCDVTCPPDIWHFHDPTHCVCGGERTDGLDRGFGSDDHFSFTVKILLPEILPLGLSFSVQVFPAAFRLGELPKVPDRDFVPEGIVPDKSAGRVGQRIGLVRPHAIRIAARPPGEGFF